MSGPHPFFPRDRNPPTSRQRSAVFLDRDGTLIEERHYLSTPDEVALVPGAGEALARLREAGRAVVVVSNQSGVGRGYFGRDDVERVNRRLLDLLRTAGGEVDGIYYCPHAPPEGAGDPGCSCRKPRPGLVERAIREMDLRLAGSLVVGDSLSDLELGWGLGLPVVLVLTGYGEETRRSLREGARGRRPDHVASDFRAAVPWIIERMESDSDFGERRAGI